MLVVLVEYESLKLTRGRCVAELSRVLCSLLAGEAAVAERAASLLVGVTHAPHTTGTRVQTKVTLA